MSDYCYWQDVDAVTVHDFENHITEEAAANIEVCGDAVWINLEETSYDLRVVIEGWNELKKIESIEGNNE